MDRQRGDAGLSVSVAQRRRPRLFRVLSASLRLLRQPAPVDADPGAVRRLSELRPGADPGAELLAGAKGHRLVCAGHGADHARPGLPARRPAPWPAAWCGRSTAFSSSRRTSSRPWRRRPCGAGSTIPQYGAANAALAALHLPPQRWLLEPEGVFAVAARTAGATLPAWAAGPSLALAV